MSICPNFPIASGKGSKQGSFTHRKRALTPMAKNHLSSNSANLTYSIREHSVCVDKGGTWPYSLLEERNRCCQNLLENSYHDNPGGSKELRIERN